MTVTERGVQVVVCSAITNIIATIVVGLRLWTRGRILHIIGKEDWCILAALIFSWGNSIGNFLQVEHALGHHGRELTEEEVLNFGKILFGTYIVYRLALTMTKVSILFLYLRLFDVPKIRKACYIQLAIVIGYGTHLVLTTIFLCTPVERFWDKKVPGHCINSSTLQYTNAGINIVTDFMILVLPLPVIGRLKLHRKQKISLYLVFALGFFVCIVSIIRLYGLHVALRSTDPSWDNTDVVLWSAIELNTGITCACLTTLKPLASRLFPRLLSSNHAEASYSYRSRFRSSRSRRSTHLESGMATNKSGNAPLDSHSDTSILRSPDNFDLENLAGEGASNNSHANRRPGFATTMDGQVHERRDRGGNLWDDRNGIRVDTVVEQRFENGAFQPTKPLSK